VNNKVLFIITAIVVTAVGTVAPAGAQRCVKIDSDPPQSTITMKNGSLVSQTTPANYCDLQPGYDYKLTVFRQGFEKRFLKFSFSDYGEAPDLSSLWPGMVGRSAILPGWGQQAMGELPRTLETWALLIPEGFKLWQAYDDYTNSKSWYDNIKVLVAVSETQQELEERTMQAYKLAQDTNAYRDNLIFTAGLGGWIYLHNVVESYLLSASAGVERLDSPDFKVRTPRKSAARAVLRSLFFPGLGQRYAGHGGRGFVFRAGVYVLALFTLDAKLRYDLAVVDRDVATMRYNEAGSVPEREALLPEVLRQQESVEKRKDSLTAFVVATGCLWLANVFEAWGSGGGGPRHSDRFEMSTTYRNSTLYQEIRFSFD
jgi:hypothetical protein